MTKIYCTNCGKEIDEDSEFCTNCGTKITNKSNHSSSEKVNTDKSVTTSTAQNKSNAKSNSMTQYPFNSNANASNTSKTSSIRSTFSSVNKSDKQKTNNASNLGLTGNGRVKIRNFIGENDNIKVVDKKGPFTVIEYEKDLSLTPREAMIMYFSSKMNVRSRQLVADLSKTSGVCLQSGSLQWMSGSNKLSSGIKGVSDFGKKYIKSKVTGESAVKPEYAGDGYVVTHKTYKHLILLDLDDFDNNLMIDDGLFLAAEKSVNLTIKARTNLSSAIASNEGLFNTVLEGRGCVCLESRVPYKEIIEIELNNDTVSIDGSMAIAWTSTLELTVEKSAKTLVGTAITREGFVNVYRGTGKILMAPLTDFIDIDDMPNTDGVNKGVAHMVFK